MNIRNVSRHWRRSLLVALGLLLLFPLNLYAQNEDPYTTSTDVDPNPLLPLEFGGVGVFNFSAGNAGDDPMPFPQGTEANLMKLTITLAFGVPNVTDPNDPAQAVAALSGDLLSYFDFTYNPAITTYTGIQKATIPANSLFAAAIPYRVTENRFITNQDPNNGAAVDVSPPGYTNPQPDSNDFASSYTYVEAKDQGDLPSPYGEAAHNIDLSPNFEGLSTRYMYLGNVVDPEDTYAGNEAATADDFDQTGGLGTDDEDGVVWPIQLEAGDTYSIPITVTLNDWDDFNPPEVARLRGWVDWNDDQVFSNSAPELIVNQDVGSDGIGTFTKNVNVTVPAGTPDGYYYARFRFGSNIGSTGTAAYGEVEDYLILVGDPTAVTIGSVDLKAASVPDFLNELGADQMDTAALWDILKAWDSMLAASAGLNRDAIVDALQQYLDPDGDGKVAVLHWDTLEERGTVGFYVERSGVNGEGATLINEDMLPGLITAPMGGEYMLADPVPTSGDVYQYRFIEQEATGNKREYGPYNLEMPQ